MHLGVNDAVIGDLVEQYQSGRSRGWFWRQVLAATFHSAKTQVVMTVGAVVLGWAVLWVCFRFLGVPVAYLLDNGPIERYSAGWWLRSALMWIAVAMPFVASGWIVAKVATRAPLLSVLTFALSVSITVLVALILDTGQGERLALRLWLTVPLFLTIAPAAAIAAGGVVAARR
jgi:hypothetical protein